MSIDLSVGVSDVFEYELNFATPEATMQNISAAMMTTNNNLYVENEKLGDMEVKLKHAEATTYIKARENAVRPTDASTTAVVDADENILRMRRAVSKQKALVQMWSRRFDTIYSDRRMFTAWYNAQNRVGMGEL